MKKTVISIAVLLALLLLGSTSLAVGPEKIWWTEWTSDVFTLDSEGSYEYTYTEQGGGEISFTVEVAEDAPAYQGTVLLRPWSIRVRTDEPGLNCANVVESPSILPGQSVRFHVAWVADVAMSHGDAEDSFDALGWTVSWNGETVSLDRQGTNPYREDMSFIDASCIWTMRP